MKTFFCLILAILLGAGLVSGQSKITVDAKGEIRVPADLANLRINLTVTGRTPGEAFEEHKRQETFLAQLIHDSELESTLLSFQPLSISGRPARDSSDRQFTTSQTVHLQLRDFSGYEKIQLLLINNGFENFSGQFSSTGLEDAGREALDLAMKSAEEKAGQIAASIGKSVRDVRSVHHTTHRISGAETFRMAEMLSADAPSMMDFETTIPVSSSVTVVYLVE